MQSSRRQNESYLIFAGAPFLSASQIPDRDIRLEEWRFRPAIQIERSGRFVPGPSRYTQKRGRRCALTRRPRRFLGSWKSDWTTFAEMMHVCAGRWWKQGPLQLEEEDVKGDEEDSMIVYVEAEAETRRPRVYDDRWKEMQKIKDVGECTHGLTRR